MRLPEHVDFSKLGDPTHGADMVRALLDLAALQVCVAHDPRNYFHRGDDSAAKTKRGVFPAAINPNKVDVLDIPLWKMLHASDVRGTTFTYTVMDDPERFQEPMRRFTLTYRVPGALTQQQLDEARAAELSALLPVAQAWMPDLAHVSDIPVSARVLAPVEVHDHREQRVYQVTDVMWTIVLGLGGSVPSHARELQVCATCKWWAPLCGSPRRFDDDFKERARIREAQQQQGLEAPVCLGWEGQKP